MLLTLLAEEVGQGQEAAQLVCLPPHGSPTLLDEFVIHLCEWLSAVCAASSASKRYRLASRLALGFASMRDPCRLTMPFVRIGKWKTWPSSIWVRTISVFKISEAKSVVRHRISVRLPSWVVAVLENARESCQ
jgi:hypothetical protein